MKTSSMLGGTDAPGFSLYRLQQDCGRLLSVGFERPLQILVMAVRRRVWSARRSMTIEEGGWRTCTEHGAVQERLGIAGRRL